MKRISNKGFFTLLEMFLVIALLGIASSLIGIKVHRMLGRHRFNHNVEKLQSLFQFCQSMAIANQDDVFLDFYSEDKKIRLESGMGNNCGFFLGQSRRIDFLKEAVLEFDGQKKSFFRLIFSSNNQKYPLAKITLLDIRNKFKANLLYE